MQPATDLSRDMAQYKPSSALILVANDVWEPDIQYFQAALNGTGASSKVIGLRAGETVDSLDRPIVVDDYLGNLAKQESPDIVVIPNGQNCIMALLSDPRVHRLIERVIEEGGKVYSAPLARYMLRRVGLINPRNLESFPDQFS